MTDIERLIASVMPVVLYYFQVDVENTVKFCYSGHVAVYLF